ncbi:hypothetical protein TcG_11973 [Trypanosoma cruzi]|nr:hypothetical protein TcG_11973 [Trypanosoma cruzi]
MVTTTASPLEKVPRSVICGAARRFACSFTDRTAQSLHCGHSVGITRCGGVRKSRSPDEDGVVVIWQLRTSGPSSFRIALAARLAQQQPDMVLLQECRHQSAPATRLIGCGDFHQVCGGRAGGVAPARRRIEYVSPPSCTRRPRFSQKDDQHLSEGSL